MGFTELKLNDRSRQCDSSIILLIWMQNFRAIVLPGSLVVNAVDAVMIKPKKIFSVFLHYQIISIQIEIFQYINQNQNYIS